MNVRLKKTWVAALGVTLTLSTAAVAVGAGTADRAADDWYDGDNATVPDPHRVAATLKLYDAAGNQVTTGSTTQPLAAFAVADSAVRADDQFASLFVHLPQKSTAPGAWPGVQATGTDRFSGAGAVAVPASLAGRPLVRAAQRSATLADVQAALPNPETTSPSFVGVYELRLRTSSATQGVADEYAAAYVKVAGGTWTVTSPPVLGGEGPDPEPVATTVTATWPARLTYGTAATVGVTVRPASGTATPTGTVTLVTGTTTLATATLSSTGTATLTLGRTALAPGSRVLRVAYSGAGDTFASSQSAARTVAVAKARPGRPTLKVTKAPTAKKAGSATVTVPTAAGLAKATGKAQVVLKKGSTTKKVAATVRAGTAKVALAKLPAGRWTVTVTYAGDARYVAATSKSVKLTVKAK